jgi:hypothetical protein
MDLKMIKIEGFETFGCPFTIVFLAHDIKDAEVLFYEKHPNADSGLFQRVVDEFGYKISTTVFEVWIG